MSNTKEISTILNIRWMLEQVEAGQQVEHLKMNVLWYIIKAWEEITAETILIVGVIRKFFLLVLAKSLG